MSFINKILEIAEPIWPDDAELPRSFQSLAPIYDSHNGAFVFESSLLILPTVGTFELPGLVEWNAPDGWRQSYPVPDDLAFFAMDVFGVQFGVCDRGVFRLEPESGELTAHAGDLEEWASKILDDYEVETGFPIAHEWQELHGSLPVGVRLLPQQPFILGGEYAVENLVPWPMSGMMEQFINLYKQIAELPDGQTVQITGWLEHEG
ncbi:hypothetical protein [Rubinisphaera margarita]|uniref:hypothetical protein n=1 Tax=Rubinisphaera margarita TaxID=2909586 RepID=UPI001EE99423|nr:hypothetical protein [Rubinisphaera margarita]MCG6155967.1 hypothetical protein [Rubinisphaera margarita]